MDCYKFFRLLHLKNHFKNADQTVQNNPVNKFKKASTFCPTSTLNPTLVTFSKLVERDVQKLALSSEKVNARQNITAEERKALDELSKNNKIIIKPADKGGSIVVQNTTDYVTEAMRQLNNSTFYERLSQNPVEQLINDRDRILDTALRDNCITKKQHEFLKVESVVTPCLYLTPKIHKSLINPPGRPIVSGNNSLSEPLSQFVDFFIRDIVKTLPSYVADTRDVLKSLNVTIPHGAYLVTFDVESLYTNIPHEDGLAAMSFYLGTKDDMPSDFLLALTKFILKSNYFMFDNKFFIQKQGTAMGSTFAPNYANLFMGYWESRFIHDQAASPHLDKLIYWRRFIDDVMAIYIGNESELLEFRDYINSTHPTLKFTMEHSKKQIDFLDLRISLDNTGHLNTTIFRKSTDRNSILHAQSHHPKRLVENIPYGQFLRLKRICSDPRDFNDKTREMDDRFKQRGYKTSTIQAAINKTKNIRRETLLEPVIKNTGDNKITFVSEYNTSSQAIKKIINKHWNILKCDPNLKGICATSPRYCFKRGKNIKDSVVTSMFKSPSTKPNWLSKELCGNHPCGRCTHCSNTSTTKVFYHPQNGKEYKIKGFINCNTTHVIYMLKCPCGLVYIGQTKRNLKIRIAEHKAAIRNGNMDYAIARHYKDKGHGSAATLKFIGLEKIELPPRGGDMKKLLLKQESFWIFELNTVEPYGLNENLDLSPFL